MVPAALRFRNSCISCECNGESFYFRKRFQSRYKNINLKKARNSDTLIKFFCCYGRCKDVEFDDLVTKMIRSDAACIAQSAVSPATMYNVPYYLPMSIFTRTVERLRRPPWLISMRSELLRGINAVCSSAWCK
jgi:hypothetical protein